jgi:hypothetical protein
MKIVYTLTIGALGCMAFGAVAQQQQSSFQTPAVVGQTTVGSPVVLKLTGVTVTDQSGQPLGPIEHILLNPSGCADMAVLSLGEDKLIPVPWRLVGASSSGSVRGEAEAGKTFVIRGVDRTILMQAPSVTVNQLNQPQTIQQTVQQVQNFYSQHVQQSAAGGTGSQTNVVGGSATNRTGIGATNQTSIGATNQTSIGATNQAGIGGTNRIGGTNQSGILSPTGPTNSAPGRPAFETNRQDRPPFNRPPTTRPPTNRPPATTPGQPPQATPNDPGQPLQ